MPDLSMLKTPEQIAGIKESCDINTGVLDYVEQHIKAGMSTEDIDVMVYDYTVSHGAIPAPLNFMGFPKELLYFSKRRGLPRHSRQKRHFEKRRYH